VNLGAWKEKKQSVEENVHKQDHSSFEEDKGKKLELPL
jgi:hypothetical protein